MPGSQTTRRISREDLEAAIARALGDGEQTARKAAPEALVVAGAVVLSILAITYLAGKRKGRHRSAVLEIRRI